MIEFVSMISYKPAVGILPYLQLDNLNTVGDRDRLVLLRSKGEVRVTARETNKPLFTKLHVKCSCEQKLTDYTFKSEGQSQNVEITAKVFLAKA